MAMASSIETPLAQKPPDTPRASSPPPKVQRPRKPNYYNIHRNLLPLEIHPLPVLIPHNPLSVIAIALSYLTQIISPPPPQPIYNGYFSSTTSSVHITNPITVRKLWEMGFFGKGSLSRSEPTWLESQRRKGKTSEEATNRRRNERRELKLERAKKEQEAIEQKLKEESGMNGSAMRINTQGLDGIASVLESGAVTLDSALNANGSIQGYDEWKNSVEVNGVLTPPPTSTSSEASLMNSRVAKKQTRVKSVRFSPTIEAREFDLTSPIISPIKNPGPSPVSEREPDLVPVDENQEHLQLSQEEAFFLVYGLGILKIYSDDSDIILPALSLLSLFRRHSYFPPRSLSIPAQPDDPFMLSYAVYHHYRSLGWVVRSGVKFSVDYLLYNRGPAFSHAEFAVVILPSYSHSYWSDSEEHRKSVQTKTGKNWWWLHCVNRVQSQVKKNLILCYVDVPPPLEEHEKFVQDDIGKLYARYKVRDVSIKRWIPNRSRD
jgi:tRNA-splicing endonuclease subunit Sen2